MGCRLKAACPTCSKKVSWSAPQASGEERSVTIKGYRVADSRIVCGNCRNYFYLSNSPNLIWESWI